jgi:hypothetical protein
MLIRWLVVVAAGVSLMASVSPAAARGGHGGVGGFGMARGGSFTTAPADQREARFGAKQTATAKPESVDDPHAAGNSAESSSEQPVTAPPAAQDPTTRR